MADYLHGAYGQINTAGNKVSDKSDSAFVYIGTAPVHLVQGGAGNVNKPVIVNNIAEAQAMFGYSDDFAKYTLCEAMKAHLIDNSVAPIVLINVLDPAVCVSEETGSATLTPVNGRVTITDAEDVCIDTLVVTGSKALVPGTDYAVSYNESKKAITIAELKSGALGTTALTITWTKIDATKVDKTAVIGTTDNMGKNTGIYAVKDVYQSTGMIPSFILTPGFSSVPDVHKVMRNVARKINGHWDAYVIADLPLTTESGETLTIATAKNWKDTNGYNGDNETVYFPMAIGMDDKHYHISVLAAANLQSLLLENDGIPYRSASNTEIMVKGLYMGEGNKDSVFDDQIINEYLCKNGIASAAYVGGRWVIWGAHTASYSYENADAVSVAETNTMMMYYLSNDFQNRRSEDVDKPLSANDLKSIVSEEQSRLDALIRIGALIYGNVMVCAPFDGGSDVVNGDYKFAFSITTTPLAKSLTAVVTWTDEGFTTYYEAMTE